jgi:hypothetical protein
MKVRHGGKIESASYIYIPPLLIPVYKPVDVQRKKASQPTVSQQHGGTSNMKDVKGICLIN